MATRPLTALRYYPSRGFLREAWRVLSARPEHVQDVISPGVAKPKLSSAERSAVAQEMVDAEAAEPDESH